MRIKFSKLSETQTAELMKYFVAGVTARAAADLVGLNRNTVTAFFDRLRGTRSGGLPRRSTARSRSTRATSGRTAAASSAAEGRLARSRSSAS